MRIGPPGRRKVIAAAALTVAFFGAPEPAVAQFSVMVARGLTRPRFVDYRATISRYGFGPFSLIPHLQVVSLGPAGQGPVMGGIGGDLILRLSHDAQPYLLGNLGAGLFNFRRSVTVNGWSLWSVGAGYEIVKTPLGAMAFEVRYQVISKENVRGIGLGVRAGAAIGRRPPPVRPIAPVHVVERVDPESPLGERAVDAALDVMGTPYKWGGTGGNGFDCSGLIQYAFGEAGITLPRRSVEQAKAGTEIPLEVDQLDPGDILAFSRSPGGAVSHVGLYLGEGRFIHSANDGVRISVLSADDPAGAWWVARWVGARRVTK